MSREQIAGAGLYIPGREFGLEPLLFDFALDGSL